jgi:drug/metabolite transporter (DMT)-like permease
MMRRDFTANAGAFIAAILFGASVVAVRVAVRDIPPLTLAILRFGQGSFLLLLLLLIWARDLLRIRVSDVPYLLLLGVIFFTIFPVTFNISLRLTEASRGALMLATMPLWSVLLARAAKKERLSTRQICGVLLTFAGVGMVLAERGLTFAGTSLSLAGDRSLRRTVWGIGKASVNSLQCNDRHRVRDDIWHTLACTGRFF